MSTLMRPARVLTISQGMKIPQLRKLIPAELLTSMLSEAAISGFFRNFNIETGEEMAPATPVSTLDRLSITKYLLDKRLPSAKAAEEDEAPPLDVARMLPDPEELKRLSISELGKIVEATYRLEEATPLPIHATAPDPPQDSEPVYIVDDPPIPVGDALLL